MTPLRVLCVLPNLNGGGAERMMINLLRLIDREKFQPTLALGRVTGQFVGHVPHDVPVVELGRERAALAPVALARALRSGNYDLCFSMVSMNLAALLTSFVLGRRTRFIVGARSHYTNSIGAEAQMSALKLLAVRVLYPRADLVIAVSDGVRLNLISRLGVPEAKIITIHNPIDIEAVQAMSLSNPHEPWLESVDAVPVLVATGALRPAKGYPDLLKAFVAIRRRRRVRLLILGEGPMRHWIEDFVRGNSLSDDVKLVGFQQNPYQYMARATVFVHAALWEGFPNVLLEAMACGVPIVATDCDSGPAEIISNESDGLLVPVGDPVRMAEAVDRLLADEERRRELSGRAGKRITAFSASSIVSRYSAAFTDVCSRPGSPK